MSLFDYEVPPQSAYLHIPFCYRRCFYCDFAVVPLGDKAGEEFGPGSNSINSYLKLLHREIDLSPKGYPLATIYIGGGTPSLLTSNQIDGLIDHLRKHFGIQDGSEITIEVDPATFNKKKIDEYIVAGVNRISLGAQSFENKILEQLGRKHRRSDVYEACEIINQQYKNGNLISWSLDLIQNLPSQNLKDWESQLQQAINTSVPHMSIYDLSVEPGTVFSRLKNRNQLSLPNEKLAIEIMRLTSSMLLEAGLSRYEISNFACPGHSSRHNRVYWGGTGWWGFGLGATSSPWGERFSRPRVRDKYFEWIKSQESHGIHHSLKLGKASSPDFLDRFLVGLRLREGIDLYLIAKHIGWNDRTREKNFNSLKLRLENTFEGDLFSFSGRRLKLHDPAGMEISNQILVEIILWWETL